MSYRRVSRKKFAWWPTTVYDYSGGGGMFSNDQTVVWLDYYNEDQYGTRWV